MVTLFVKHMVKDYGDWKRVYDEFAPTRRQLGVTGASVHRDTGARDRVTVTHQFKDLAAAQAFAGSEELRSAMHDAGVAGQPDIWYAEDIEQTPF